MISMYNTNNFYYQYPTDAELEPEIHRQEGTMLLVSRDRSLGVLISPQFSVSSQQRTTADSFRMVVQEQCVPFL